MRKKVKLQSGITDQSHRKLHANKGLDQTRDDKENEQNNNCDNDLGLSANHFEKLRGIVAFLILLKLI